MAKVPRIPPDMASKVSCANCGCTPHTYKAGIVKMTPDAIEELAEPIVCDMLVSRMECGLPVIALRDVKVTTESTAMGMDVLMVSPPSVPDRR